MAIRLYVTARPALSFLAFAFALGASLLACEPAPRTPADQGPQDPTVEYVARQQILTDLPMRVRLPARYGAERVLVFVHLWGMRGWSTFELGRDGQTWAGAVSCRAVSTVTGDAKYYFLALDARGEPIVGSGSPEWPHVATIVRELPDGPQRLPDQAPPAMCHDPADCPPDFAGCPAYAVVRPSCRSDADCGEHDDRDGNVGRCAWDGYCEGGREPGVGVGAGPSDANEELEAAVRNAILKAKRGAKISAR